MGNRVWPSLDLLQKMQTGETRSFVLRDPADVMSAYTNVQCAAKVLKYTFECTPDNVNNILIVRRTR